MLRLRLRIFSPDVHDPTGEEVRSALRVRRARAEDRVQDVVRVGVQHDVLERRRPQAADLVPEGAQTDLRPRQLQDGAGGEGVPREDPRVDGEEAGGDLRPAAVKAVPAGDQLGASP